MRSLAPLSAQTTVSEQLLHLKLWPPFTATFGTWRTIYSKWRDWYDIPHTYVYIHIYIYIFFTPPTSRLGIHLYTYIYIYTYTPVPAEWGIRICGRIKIRLFKLKSCHYSKELYWSAGMSTPAPPTSAENEDLRFGQAYFQHASALI